MRAKRNYSIDLLKCISMLMVVVLHLNQYGLKNVAVDSLNAIGIIKSFLHSFSIVGVNLFVLISGYYLSSKSIELNREGVFRQYKRLIPLWVQVVMYSIGIYLLLCVIPQSGVQFSIKQLVKQALPLLTNQYWFFTVYFLLILVTPFINKLICGLEYKEYRIMMIVLLITFSVVPTINIFGDTFGTEYGYSLLWFIVLYCVGGYIKRFEIKNCKYGLYYLGFVVFFFCCHLLSNIAPKVFSGLENLFSNYYTSLFVFGASVSLFLFFLKSKKEYRKTGKVIALISTLSFAVYLIHEHPLFRDILWEKIINPGDYLDNTAICFLVMLLSVVVIYFTGIIIEFVRSKTIASFVAIWNHLRKHE